MKLYLAVCGPICFNLVTQAIQFQVIEGSCARLSLSGTVCGTSGKWHLIQSLISLCTILIGLQLSVWTELIPVLESTGAASPFLPA